MPARASVRETIDIVVESTPAGAQVMLNGSVVGKTPFRGAMARSAGASTLVIKLSGYADRTITVRSDQAIHQRVELVKVPAPTQKRDQAVNPFAK